MHALLLCLATAAVGVEVGWQELPEGGMEYIIQLDPQTLESLAAGQAFRSDIHPEAHPEAGEIRSYRILVGKQPLPREIPPEPRESFSTAPQTLPSGSAGKRIAERLAVHVESEKPVVTNEPPPPKTSSAPTDQPAKPWWPLTFTLLGLFASIGLNLFLGWIAWDSRQRFLANAA